MRRILVSLALVGWLLYAARADAALVVSQHTGNAYGTTTASDTLTVSSTGAGHVLILQTFISGTSAEHVASISDGTTNFSHIGEVSGTQTGFQVTMDTYYLLSSASGKTTITINYVVSNGAFKAVEFWEVAGFTTPAVDGVMASTIGGTAGTTGGFDITGPSKTTTTAVGFVAAFVSPDNSIVQNPKTGNAFTAGGDSNGGAGGASLISSAASTYTPVWTSDTSGQGFSAITAAFKETAAGGTCTPTLSLMGVGRCG